MVTKFGYPLRPAQPAGDTGIGVSIICTIRCSPVTKLIMVKLAPINHFATDLHNGKGVLRVTIVC